MEILLAGKSSLPLLSSCRLLLPPSSLRFFRAGTIMAASCNPTPSQGFSLPSLRSSFFGSPSRFSVPSMSVFQVSQNSSWTTQRTFVASIISRQQQVQDTGYVLEPDQSASVTFTSILAAYTQEGNTVPLDCKAPILTLKADVVDEGDGKKPDFIAEIDKSICLEDLKQGKITHAAVVYQGRQADHLLTTALALMYGTCKCMDEAAKLFDKLSYWDPVSMNVMVCVYSLNGEVKVALDLFRRMVSAGIKPCPITFNSLLSACGSLESLVEGKIVHLCAINSACAKEVQVVLALAEMYGKFLGLESSRNMFGGVLQQNAGMKPQSVRPTFSDILSANDDRVGEPGLEFLVEPSTPPSSEKTSEELQEELRRLIETPAIPVNKDASETGMLQKAESRPVNAPSKMVDVDRGARVAERVFELDPGNAAPHVLLSNIYAAAGRWDDVARVRKAMRDKGLKKEPGKSCIEIKSKIHEFVSGDRYHPEREAIYTELNRLMKEIEEAGYVADTKTVLHDVEESRKKHLLYHHSERLAIAYGLLKTPPGTPLRIIKNLRVCTDCHTASKFISKVTGRKLIMRDAKRFHHVEDGVCSCGDYW